MMGSYGIGVGRLMAAVVEAHSDDRGIRWPEELAPFDIHLIGIGRSLTVQRETEAVYEDLGPDRVLWDDRKESAGVQLKDADLLGIPLRIVVSQRHVLDGKVELTWRETGETIVVEKECIKETIESRKGGIANG
jgi:prolyl-tRNA synthetase